MGAVSKKNQTPKSNKNECTQLRFTYTQVTYISVLLLTRLVRVIMEFIDLLIITYDETSKAIIKNGRYELKGNLIDHKNTGLRYMYVIICMWYALITNIHAQIKTKANIKQIFRYLLER